MKTFYATIAELLPHLLCTLEEVMFSSFCLLCSWKVGCRIDWVLTVRKQPMNSLKYTVTLRFLHFAHMCRLKAVCLLVSFLFSISLGLFCTSDSLTPLFNPWFCFISLQWGLHFKNELPPFSMHTFTSFLLQCLAMSSVLKSVFKFFDPPLSYFLSSSAACICVREPSVSVSFSMPPTPSLPCLFCSHASPIHPSSSHHSFPQRQWFLDRSTVPAKGLGALL